MEVTETMIQIEDVSKVYRLGEIGGTTLTEAFQRLGASIRHKEDPTKKIGAKNYNKGEKFLALNNINLNIRKGDCVGIIGHNGAGKSTLLKLICRVTAPTTGRICLNGRITSMLEVGTGFHPELTGRENIYMNGAILGMTKREIDKALNDIIDFSEVREFIDTPVKRYSSGMYVKLAFSVAAHLESEIMIMDEVLAVGDINFQQKCIRRMKELADCYNKTILFVSHNMQLIRNFCNRVVVIDHGNIVFDGGVDDGIEFYTVKQKNSVIKDNNLDSKPRISDLTNNIRMTRAVLTCCSKGKLSFLLSYVCNKKYEELVVRAVFFDRLGIAICTAYSPTIFNSHKGNNEINMTINIDELVNGLYHIDLIISSVEEKRLVRHDVVREAITINIDDGTSEVFNLRWDSTSWGKIRLKDIEIQ